MPLVIDFKSAQSKRGTSDRIDVAIGRFIEEQRSWLEHMRPFSTRSIEEFEPEIGISRYVSLGFPASKSKATKLMSRELSEALGVICGCSSHPPSRPNNDQYKDGINCFLQYRQKECLDASGNALEGFSVRGMSGCLIVRMGDYGDHGVLAGTKPPSIQPVGVLIEHLQQEKIVVGTRLDFILKAGSQLF